MRAAGLRLAAVFAIALLTFRVDAGDGARTAAAAFGKALVTGRADALRPILPERGRVHLTLLRLGPEEGLFGAQQVEALFRDFLVRGTVSSFDVSRCEGDPRGEATAHATAAIIDREGRSGRIGLHLGFEPEGGRWVLREVKETAE
jgi:hypothetical protein